MRNRGLDVDIYRTGGPDDDCTLNGATSVKSGRRRAILMGIPRGNVTEQDIVNTNEIVLDLVKRTVRGEDYYIAIPRGIEGRPSFGGNFVYTSDSRFGDAMGNLGHPIAVHDRVER